MRARSRIDSVVGFLGVVTFVLCLTGAVCSMFVVLIRVPTLASSRLELLFGTLLGTALGLLFAMVGLLVHLTVMVRRLARSQGEPPYEVPPGQPGSVA